MNSRRWLAPLIVLGVGCVCVAHVVLRDAYYSAFTGVCGGLLSVTTLAAWVVYAIRRPPRLPILEAALFYHYLHYGLPVTVEPLALGVANITPHAESHESAAVLAVFCSISLIVGHAVVVHWSRDRVPRMPLPDLTVDELFAASRIFVPFTACLVVVVALAPSLAVAFNSIGTFTNLLSYVPLTVVAGLTYFARPSKRTAALLALAGFAIVFATAATSMLSAFVLPAAVLVVLWWVLRRSVPWLLVTATVLLMLVAQPAKSYYRVTTQRGEQTGLVTGWRQAITKAQEADAFTPYDSTVARLSELSTLAYTIELVPSVIPHTEGKTYRILGISMVPRLLWPDKPNMTTESTDAFTITLGLQTTEWAEKSALALSVPPHGYLEHGVAGAIVWVMIVGALQGALSHMFPTDRGWAGLVAAGLILGRVVFAYDGGFVAFVTTCIQWLVFSTGFVWILHLLGRAQLSATKLRAVPRPFSP